MSTRQSPPPDVVASTMRPVFALLGAAPLTIVIHEGGPSVAVLILVAAIGAGSALLGSMLSSRSTISVEERRGTNADRLAREARRDALQIEVLSNVHTEIAELLVEAMTLIEPQRALAKSSDSEFMRTIIWTTYCHRIASEDARFKVQASLSSLRKVFKGNVPAEKTEALAIQMIDESKQALEAVNICIRELTNLESPDTDG